jgi:hypothetical protein
MTDGVVRNSAAALVKLFLCATRTNVLSLFKSLSAAVNDGISFSFGSRFGPVRENLGLRFNSCSKIGATGG